jgi:hypothetical protein
MFDKHVNIFIPADDKILQVMDRVRAGLGLRSRTDVLRIAIGLLDRWDHAQTEAAKDLNRSTVRKIYEDSRTLK